MTRIRRFWSSHFLGCEMALVVVAIAAFVIWSECWSGRAHIAVFMDNRRGMLYGATAAIFGSLLGFAITAESIVLSLSGHERLSIVRKSSHYRTLWKVFVSTIRALGLATVAAFTALIFDREQSPQWTVLYITIFFSLYAVARLVRTIWVLEQVVAIVGKPAGQVNQ